MTSYCIIGHMLPWKINDRNTDIQFLRKFVSQLIRSDKMSQYSVQQRIWIVEHYFRSYGYGRSDGPSLRIVKQGVEEEFGVRSPPNKTCAAISVKVVRLKTKTNATVDVRGPSGQMTIMEGKVSAGSPVSWIYHSRPYNAWFTILEHIRTKF